MRCLNQRWRSVNLYFPKYNTSKIAGSTKILKKYIFYLPPVQSEYIYIYINRFSDKEKQLFWNLKFHAVLLAIFSQLTPTLNCYSAMVYSSRHIISLVPEWKTHPNPVMTSTSENAPETLHTPSVKWGRDPGITPTYAKTQDCSILSIPAPMM